MCLGCPIFQNHENIYKSLVGFTFVLKLGRIILIGFLLLVNTAAFAQENNGINGENQDSIYFDIGEVKIEEGAGLTPDSPLYFIDDLAERVFIGNNPKRVLAYKEEKIVEARLMIEEGKIEEAKRALLRAEKYGTILEKEVSPDIERRARESSKAIKEVFTELKYDIEGDEWEDVRILVEEHDKREDKIALTAKISGQVKRLCESLSELDPLEYSRVCRTDKDSPEWQKRLDEDLTKEQEQEARKFFGIMSECFQNPRECRCEDIGVSSFADACSEIAPLAARCMDGDESACTAMENIEDPIDLLPLYLQEVMEEVEERFGDTQYDLHIPSECREAGATDRKSCMGVMFKIHAPEECIRALEEGRISIDNEREARKACEEIMFTENAPEECVEAGIRDPRECGKLMFKTNAPPECIEAGLTGESRDDDKKCRDIMERVMEKDRRGSELFGGADCRRIESPEERLKCYDSALKGIDREFEERADFEGRGPSGGWPEPCARENAFTRESCERVMSSFVERDFEEERFEQHKEFERESDEFEEHKEFDETMDKDEMQGEHRGEERVSEPEQHQEESQSEPSPEASSGESTGDASITGGAISTPNRFLKYYYR